MQIEKTKYFKAADNFVALCENHNKLIRLDSLEVIKNLSESTYILLDKNVFTNTTPAIISSSNPEISNKLFESYNEMVETCNSILGQNITPLFESQISNENNLIVKRNEKLVSLNEEQLSLNKAISDVKRLQSMAEPDSPAMDKLNEQYGILDNKLQKNLEDTNTLKNNFKLY